jgi:hypothetical protein
VIDAAADYYAATKRMIFVSIFYFIIHIAFFAALLVGIFYLYSTNTFGWNGIGASTGCTLCG